MRLLSALATALSASVVGAAPVLEQPIDCALGETCFIQNYVDSDPSDQAADYACGGLSYDGHDGTDFALPTLADIRRQVTVLAAAPGVVAGLRDGMPDIAITETTRGDVAGRECGNGVAIDHGDGWVSQYCHMKQGSIAVKKGQNVAAGDPLGHVGLSGLTQFPHLHIALRHQGQVIDPFAPSGAPNSCGTSGPDSLWASPPDYVPGGLLQSGFDTAIPAYLDVFAGTTRHAPLARTAPALVLFAYGYGSRIGDAITFSITGPDGFQFDHTVTLTKAQARFMRAAGKKRRTAAWPSGIYSGTVTFLRDGRTVDQQTLQMTIP